MWQTSSLFAYTAVDTLLNSDVKRRKNNQAYMPAGSHHVSLGSALVAQSSNAQVNWPAYGSA
jgi:hypothetical protein